MPFRRCFCNTFFTFTARLSTFHSCIIFILFYFFCLLLLLPISFFFYLSALCRPYQHRKSVTAGFSVLFFFFASFLYIVCSSYLAQRRIATSPLHLTRSVCVRCRFAAARRAPCIKATALRTMLLVAKLIAA